MAATVTPPVRGRHKLRVAGTLVAAAGISGGLAGFGAGVLAAVAGLPRPSAVVAAAVVAAAVSADFAVARRGRPRPPAVSTQVPQVWSAVFGPGTVAGLYGARLGVGPLTLLPTWLWWAMFGLAAATGPGAAAVAGATFGLVRTLAGIAAGEWAAPAGVGRMQRLRAWEPRVGTAASVAAAGVTLALVAAGA